MKAPLIHIGFPKAASTWFQKRYFPKIKNTVLIHRKTIYKQIRQPSTPEFEKDEYRHYFDCNYQQQLILSEELFSGKSYFSVLKTALRLRTLLPDGKILIILRKQPDILASKYISYIKRGGTETIHEFIRRLFFREKAQPQFSFKHRYNYLKVLSLYYNLFGKDNIYVLLYEEFIKQPEKCVSLINKWMGFNEFTGRIKYKPVNIAYRTRCMQWALLANKFSKKRVRNKQYYFHIPGWYRFSRFIINIINRTPLSGRKQSALEILGRDNYELIAGLYRESNQRLAEDFGLKRITDLGYPV